GDPPLSLLLPPQPRVELAWAMKAHQHAQVYFNFLNLTKVDEQIYGEFRKTFRDLKIDVLDPEELKSEPAKEKWRPFCLRFEGVVEDFNYGTLLRLDCRKDYTEENTIFATRIQFFAIEIARNREGCNSVVYSSARAPAEGALCGRAGSESSPPAEMGEWGKKPPKNQPNKKKRRQSGESAAGHGGRGRRGPCEKRVDKGTAPTATPGERRDTHEQARMRSRGMA
uniref:Polysaccharide biosynthesis domain containing 1 n=1 Tax=Strix occidentalis caurina TaxID=311401 RepID=A0A8D0F2P6_STROC